MERKSPDRSSPDPLLDLDFDPNNTMSVAVASGHVPNMPGPVGGVNKRYRPAPAKTFQCRGYGDCRMVFSRSEHLARHIRFISFHSSSIFFSFFLIFFNNRKHTGERPFTCHCGKQFSRLDNLRQHAQTVHADKQEQNERMMRDLTSLHATMAAANKAGHPRGARRTSGATAPQQSSAPASNDVDGMGIIKQEELSLGMHQRPDTSTGYEGDHTGMVYQTSSNWHIQTSNMEPPRPSSRSGSSNSAASNGGNHSFRDSSQSFLVPPTSSTSSTSASGQSFLGFPSIGFTIPSDGPARPTGSSRPPTANADPSQPRSLPPLAAVVSASIPAQSSHQQLYASSPSSASQSSLHQQQQQHILSFPPPSSLRRPGTGGNRPGTAPASSALYHPTLSHSSGSTAAAKSSYYGGSGLGGAQLQLSYGRAYAADLGAGPGYESASAGSESDASPFFFQPPDTTPPLTHISSRPYPAPPSSSGGIGEYDYGSDSRPQSRRLSVMELCNDDHNGSATGVSAGAFLLSGAGGPGASRPGTSSSALAALALTDRERSPSSASSASSPSPTSPRSARGEVHAYAAGADTGSGRGAAPEFHAGNGAGHGHGHGGAPPAAGGRVSPAHRRVPPPPPAAAAAGAAGGAVFRGYAPAAHSPSPAPYSPEQPPPAQPYSPTGAYGGFVPSPTFSAASASSYGGAGDGGGASPFSPRSPSFVPQSPAAAAAAAAYGQQQEAQYGHGHGDGGGQVRGGIRAGGPGHGHGHGYGHHARSYGMRV